MDAMLPRSPLRRALAVLILTVPMVSAAHAARPLPIRPIAYSNDQTVRKGVTEACIVRAVGLLGSGGRRLEFQLLVFPAIFGWKASVSDPAPGNVVATVRNVRFAGAAGALAPGVRKANAAKGELLAYLVDMKDAKAVIAAFFHGDYAVEVAGPGKSAAQVYRTFAAPAPAVFNQFRTCIDALTRR